MENKIGESTLPCFTPLCMEIGVEFQNENKYYTIIV